MEIKFAVSLAGLKEKSCRTQKGISGEKRAFLIPPRQNSALYAAKILKRFPIGFIVVKNVIGNQKRKQTRKIIKYTIAILNGGGII